MQRRERGVICREEREARYAEKRERLDMQRREP